MYQYDYTDGPPTLAGIYTKSLVIGYDGPLKDFSEIGVVTTKPGVCLTVLDGKSASFYRTYKTSSLMPGGRFQIHLSPGIHTLSMCYRFESPQVFYYSKEDVTRTLFIQKGEVIHLQSTSPSRNSWGIEFHDGSKALPTIKADFDELIKLQPKSKN